jgi:hypothetical protein
VTIDLAGHIASTDVERIVGRNEPFDARRVMMPMRPSSLTPSLDPMGDIRTAR